MNLKDKLTYPLTCSLEQVVQKANEHFHFTRLNRVDGSLGPSGDRLWVNVSLKGWEVTLGYEDARSIFGPLDEYTAREMLTRDTILSDFAPSEAQAEKMESAAKSIRSGHMCPGWIVLDDAGYLSRIGNAGAVVRLDAEGILGVRLSEPGCIKLSVQYAPSFTDAFWAARYAAKTGIVLPIILAAAK